MGACPYEAGGMRQMARSVRIEFPDAIGHMTSRGNERRACVE
jgi:hypothetical protein